MIEIVEKKDYDKLVEENKILTNRINRLEERIVKMELKNISQIPDKLSWPINPSYPQPIWSNIPGYDSSYPNITCGAASIGLNQK